MKKKEKKETNKENKTENKIVEMKFSERMKLSEHRSYVVFLVFICALIIWRSQYFDANCRTAYATKDRSGIFQPTPEEEIVWRVNLNKATEAELVQLPRIGSALARRILDYRDEIGRFETVDDLLEVKGIGPATFDKIKRYCYVVDEPAN